MTLKKIVSIILVLASLFVLTAFTRFTQVATDEKSQEELCRASVFARESLQVEVPVVGSQKIVPLQCSTFPRVLPLNFYERSREGIMGSFGQLAAKCWWMFGEGLYEGTLKTRWNGKPCHVCYSVTIDDSGIADRSGDDLFSGVGLQNYFFENIYIVDPEWHETFCGDNIDNDEDGDIDMADEDCNDPTRFDSDCTYQGGLCVPEGSSCPDKYRKFNDIEWTCREEDGVKQECCVHEDNSYTYFEYVQMHGDESGILFVMEPDKTIFNSGGHYAVALMDFKIMPSSQQYVGAISKAQVDTYLENFEAEKFNPNIPADSHIWIGEYDQLAAMCNEVKMSGLK